MIASFNCKDTQALFSGKRVARFANIASVAMRKLQQINAATTLEFLRIPPGNRLEQLSGNRSGQHSIRINDQWRLCFRFEGGNVFEIEIVDYH
jgi:proteic killer suppression protein